MGQQRSLVAGDAHLLSHRFGNVGAVAGKHHGATPHFAQLPQGVRRLAFYLVGNSRKAAILPVVRNVHHGAATLFVGNVHPVLFQQFGVAAQNDVLALLRYDAPPCHVCKHVVFVNLAVEACRDGTRDGVVGVLLRYGCKAQHVLAVDGMHLCHGEVALGKRARFVKYENIGFVKFFQIVRAFYQNTFARGGSYAGKKG